ncbi:hypothetical protein GCM10027032_25880 [Simplicispira piscis]
MAIAQWCTLQQGPRREYGSQFPGCAKFHGTASAGRAAVWRGCVPGRVLFKGIRSPGQSKAGELAFFQGYDAVKWAKLSNEDGDVPGAVAVGWTFVTHAAQR